MGVVRSLAGFAVGAAVRGQLRKLGTVPRAALSGGGRVEEGSWAESRVVGEVLTVLSSK